MAYLAPRKWISLGAFGVLMLAAIPVNLAFIRAEGNVFATIAATFDRFAKGKMAEELTAKYNNASPFKEDGIALFGSFSYFAFNEARNGAQIGADGWLFSNEEFETGPHSEERIARAVNHIAAVRDALAKRNVRLVVAPLPLKTDIALEKLGSSHAPAPELLDRYQRFREALDGKGVDSADIRTAMLMANTERPMFLKTDTHWTPDGASVTAEAIRKEIANLTLPAEKTFALETAPARLHDGDLLKFVRLLPAFENLGPKPDFMAEKTAVAQGTGESKGEGEGDLFGDAAIPVALVGTSYSANAKFGFEASLKATLQRDVLNVAEEGKGPFAPMRAYLDSAAFKDTPPTLVIWEMPVRYLDDVFPNEQFTLPASLP
jgi:alginate O-acetyltransferase complex protein AlgJ